MKENVAFDRFGCCDKCEKLTWLYDVAGESWCDNCMTNYAPKLTTMVKKGDGVFPELGDEQLKSTFNNNRISVAFLINKYLKYCVDRGLNPLKGAHCEEMKQPLAHLIFNIYISQTILNMRASGATLDDFE